MSDTTLRLRAAQIATQGLLEGLQAKARLLAGDLQDQPASDFDGVAIMLLPREQDLKAVSRFAAVKKENLHCTLLYLGDASEMKATADEVRDALLAMAGRLRPVKATLGGVIRFSGKDDDPIVLSVDSPDIMSLHLRVKALLAAIGVFNASEHGFTPHMTLGYLPKKERLELATWKPQDIVFDRIRIGYGGQNVDLVLGINNDKAEFKSLETKGVRRVRDVSYWKQPYGTPIVAGMTPDKTARSLANPEPKWDENGEAELDYGRPERERISRDQWQHRSKIGLLDREDPRWLSQIAERDWRNQPLSDDDKDKTEGYFNAQGYEDSDFQTNNDLIRAIRDLHDEVGAVPVVDPLDLVDQWRSGWFDDYRDIVRDREEARARMKRDMKADDMEPEDFWEATLPEGVDPDERIDWDQWNDPEFQRSLDSSQYLHDELWVGAASLGDPDDVESGYGENLAAVLHAYRNREQALTWREAAAAHQHIKNRDAFNENLDTWSSLKAQQFIEEQDYGSYGYAIPEDFASKVQVGEMDTRMGDEIFHMIHNAFKVSHYVEDDEANSWETYITAVEFWDDGKTVNVRGDIRNLDGEYIGEWKRDFDFDTLSVYHDLFRIESDQQGQGISDQFYDESIVTYRGAGFDHVDVSANIDVGGYAWARRGFQWRTGKPDPWLVETLERQWGILLSENPSWPVAFKTEGNALLRRLKGLTSGSETIPTPEEVASFGQGRVLMAPKVIEKEGKQVLIPMHPGKAMMLGRTWAGRLPLDENTPLFSRKSGDAQNWLDAVRSLYARADELFIPGVVINEGRKESDFNVHWADLFAEEALMQMKNVAGGMAGGTVSTPALDGLPNGRKKKKTPTALRQRARALGAMDEKADRYVRTPEGAAHYGQPIGSLIVAGPTVRIEGVPGKIDKDDPNIHEPYDDRNEWCYQHAAQYAIANSDPATDKQMFLVHGSVQISPNYPAINHSWVEFPNGDVFEPNSGHRMTHKEFEDFFHPVIEAEYDAVQMRRQIMKHQHWGPWHEEDDSNPVFARLLNRALRGLRGKSLEDGLVEAKDVYMGAPGLSPTRNYQHGHPVPRKKRKIKQRAINISMVPNQTKDQPVDGDGDGYIYDGTSRQRPAPPGTPILGALTYVGPSQYGSETTTFATVADGDGNHFHVGEYESGVWVAMSDDEEYVVDNCKSRQQVLELLDKKTKNGTIKPKAKPKGVPGKAAPKKAAAKKPSTRTRAQAAAKPKAEPKPKTPKVAKKWSELTDEEKTKMMATRGLPPEVNPLSKKKWTQAAIKAQRASNLKKGINNLNDLIADKLANGYRLVDEQERYEIAQRTGKPIPPRWSHFFVYDGPDAATRKTTMYGINWDYAWQPYQTKEQREQGLDDKFIRYRALVKELPTMLKKTRLDINKGNEQALAARTMLLSGGRVDSGESKTGAVGISTLQAKHISVKGGVVTLDYVGKSRQRNIYVIEDPLLALEFKQRLADMGPEDRMFPDTTDKKTLAYIKQFGDFTNHDLRTARANSVGMQAIRDYLSEGEIDTKDPKSIKGIVDHVSKVVGEKINDKPAVAYGSYIDPMIFVAVGIEENALPPRKGR